MPVGPSHGSRGRSSSSRSSSSFGSSRSRSSSSSNRSYSSSRSYGGNRTTVIYAGGGGGFGGSGVAVPPMSLKSKKISWLILGIIFCLIFGMLGASMFSRNIGAAVLMKKDAKEYAQIINNAKEGKDGYYLIHIDGIRLYSGGRDGYDIHYSFSSENYNFRANAYNYIQKDGVEYFYIEYSFTDDEGRRINGETYTAYSEAAVESLYEMTIAYTKVFDGDGSWDSMDVNYKLKNNIDYWQSKTRSIIGGFLAIIFFGLTVLFVYMIVRIKQDKPIFKKPDDTVIKTTQKERLHRTCMYCGGIVKEDVFKCPSCGSRQFHEPTVKKGSEQTGANIAGDEVNSGAQQN